MTATHIPTVPHFEGVSQVFHAPLPVVSQLAGRVARAGEAIGHRDAARLPTSRASSAAWLNSGAAPAR